MFPFSSLGWMEVLLQELWKPWKLQSASAPSTLQGHSCTGGIRRESWLVEFELQFQLSFIHEAQLNWVFSRHLFTLEAASPLQIRHRYPKVFNPGTHFQERGVFFHSPISDKCIGKCWTLNIICLSCWGQCINPTHCVLWGKRIGREKKISWATEGRWRENCLSSGHLNLISFLIKIK